MARKIHHDCTLNTTSEEYTEEEFKQHLIDHHGYTEQEAIEDIENIKERNKVIDEWFRERKNRRFLCR